MNITHFLTNLIGSEFPTFKLVALQDKCGRQSLFTFYGGGMKSKYP